MKIIKSTEELAAVCREMAAHDFVTVDTEFLRQSTYWPILCLIQMATPDQEVIVDVMAKGISLEPFFELMADKSVVKVFHAARQDIEIIYYLGNLIPSPVFDTQIASMVCGYGDSISYDQLVQRITGRQLDKSSRFTDWSARPLSEKQLRYALGDVTHLRDVYIKIREQLESQNRTHWLEEEMEVLTSVSTYDIDPEESWKRLKMRSRKPLELAITQMVAAWREETAKEENLPRGRVIKDDGIYAVAANPPGSVKELSRMRGLSQGFDSRRFGESLLQVVQRAREIPKEELPAIPRSKRPAEGAQAATELLKVLLKAVIEDQGVAAKIIATVDDLEKIANDDNADVPALKGWRRELFGNRALDLKHGKLALGFDGIKVEIIELEDA